MEDSGSLHYIWKNLRKILILFFFLLLLFAVGTVIGYSVIGDGKAGDVFHSETWTHITDFLK